jgi:hypothetical protein
MNHRRKKPQTSEEWARNALDENEWNWFLAKLPRVIQKELFKEPAYRRNMIVLSDKIAWHARKKIRATILRSLRNVIKIKRIPMLDEEFKSGTCEKHKTLVITSLKRMELFDSSLNKVLEKDFAKLLPTKKTKGSTKFHEFTKRIVEEAKKQGFEQVSRQPNTKSHSCMARIWKEYVDMSPDIWPMETILKRLLKEIQ